MDPALWELWQRGEQQDEVAAIVRLSSTTVLPARMRVIASFGEIATCRLQRGAILGVRGEAEVNSLKAPRPLLPDLEVELTEALSEAVRETDERRSSTLDATGHGVVVGVVDWGFDFAHPDFCREDGSSRILALWDQRSQPGKPAPQPYGYGVVHTQAAINQGLATPNPYATLGYHPADADPGGGCHATHVASIAAGNGRGGGTAGLAPEADLVFVHMSTLDAPEQDKLGDSVTLLEAIDFITHTAGNRPCVINLSMGQHGEQHDGTTLVEQAIDAILQARVGLAIVQSTGNYYGRRIHTSGQLRPTETREIVWQVRTGDPTSNQLEVWYSGRDVFEVELCSPNGICQKVILGDRAPLNLQGKMIGTIYHRAREPNNLDNHINIFLYAGCPPGNWKVKLSGKDVVDGRYNAWIERDDSAPNSQSHFHPEDAIDACTTGTICNGFRTIAVGAYNPHSSDHEIGSFSSAGPTRDGRIKPDLVAPGVDILAARSTPYNLREDTPLLTRKSGTSMAAPHVAGTVALMFEVAPRPLHINETRNLLLATTRPPSHAIDQQRSGSGYLDVDRAVSAARHLNSLDSPLKQSNTPQEVAMYSTPSLADNVAYSEWDNDWGETALSLGQLTINGTLTQITASSTTPERSVITLDQAIQFILSQSGQFVIVGDLLNSTNMQIFRIDPTLAIPATPVIAFTPSANVCALVFNSADSTKGYFPANPVTPGQRWVEIPRLREFYALAEIDRREQRRLWISRIFVASQRLAIPNVTITQAWLQRLSMPALRLLLSQFASNIFSVRSVDEPARRFRGGDVAGVTLPLVRYPLVEPDCYLPVISGREGKLEAINAYDLGAGISLGAIQFNVQRGALFRFLWSLWQQDRDLFNQEFGTPLVWSMQQQGGTPKLLINAETAQEIVLQGTNSDADRAIGYLQSGTPGRTAFNEIDADFRRRLAAHFRNVVACPHVQELIIETTAWWLSRGLMQINNAGIPALNAQAPDRDTFILKALLLSAYVRYSACLAPLLTQLQAWTTPSEKLQNLVRVLDQAGEWSNCTLDRRQRLKERLQSQESDAVRIYNLIQRLIPTPAGTTTTTSRETVAASFPVDVVSIDDAAIDAVELDEDLSEWHECGSKVVFDLETDALPVDVFAIDDAVMDAAEIDEDLPEFHECGCSERYEQEIVESNGWGNGKEKLVEWAETAIANGYITKAPGALVSHVFAQAGISESLNPLGESNGFPSPALMFDAFTPGGSPALQRHFAQFFEVVAMPSMMLSQSIQSGDLLVRRALGEGNFAHVAMIAAPELYTFEQLETEQFTPETSQAGWYAQVVEGGVTPHTRDHTFARRVLDANGRLLSDQIVLRPIMSISETEFRNGASTSYGAANQSKDDFSEGSLFWKSDNQKRMMQIRRDAGNDDAEALARIFEDTSIKDSGSLVDRLNTILRETKYFNALPLHTALDFHDNGFKTDFKDPHPSSDNQVGHFLTAVSFGSNPDQISWLRGGLGADSSLSNEEVAMRLAIGHELYPDPSWWNIAAFLSLPGKLFLSPNLLPNDIVDVFAKQFQATTPADVTAFKNALAALPEPSNPLTVNLSAAVPYLRSIEIKIQPSNKGNSIQDLRLTLMGWHLALEIAKGRLKNCSEVAQWIRTNLHA